MGREQQWALKATLAPENGVAVYLLIFNAMEVLEPLFESLPEVRVCSNLGCSLQAPSQSFKC